MDLAPAYTPIEISCLSITCVVSSHGACLPDLPPPQLPGVSLVHHHASPLRKSRFAPSHLVFSIEWKASLLAWIGSGLREEWDWASACVLALRLYCFWGQRQCVYIWTAGMMAVGLWMWMSCCTSGVLLLKPVVQYTELLPGVLLILLAVIPVHFALWSGLWLHGEPQPQRLCCFLHRQIFGFVVFFPVGSYKNLSLWSTVGKGMQTEPYPQWHWAVCGLLKA